MLWVRARIELALGLRLRLALAATFYPIASLQVLSTGSHLTRAHAQSRSEIHKEGELNCEDKI